MFLLPGLVFTSYITGAVIPEEYKTEMIRYLYNHQNHDGGWGLYVFPVLRLAYNSLVILNPIQPSLEPLSITYLVVY
jgi:hypothetical protein